MSAIYKLSIQGIRSFDSGDRETIEFGKPLTLIVGSNGSGKTTVIECLKYATTGALPPNSKGGAFIHDPRITGEKDVRAQVKLAFTSASGVSMIVTRNIQLLVKKTANTFKTLEGQLVAVNRNERTTLSTRANELDTQVPLYMGVPRAILDYVIFCHQEESLWPLSEPSNLKKRFDEIFQAMKFTKALDNLKAIRKDMSVDIKLLKQSVEHLKVDRDRSRATQVNIASLQQKIEEYQAQVCSIEQQLDEITEQSDKLFRSNQEFQQVLSTLASMKHNESSVCEQIKRLEGSIEPLDMGRRELESLLANFADSVREKQEEVDAAERQLQGKRDRLDLLRDNHTRLVLQQGELNSKRTNYEKNVQARDSLAREVCSQYGISAPAPTCGASLSAEIGRRLGETQASVQELAASHQREQTALQQRLTGLQNSLAKDEQHLKYSIADRAKLSKDIENLRDKLNRIAYTAEDLEREQHDVDKFTARVEHWKDVNQTEQINAEIKRKNDESVLLESNLEKVQQQITKSNQHSDLFARLSLLKKALEAKRRQVQECHAQFAQDPRAQEWGLVQGLVIGVDKDAHTDTDTDTDTDAGAGTRTRTDIDANIDLGLRFGQFYATLQKAVASSTQDYDKAGRTFAENRFLLSSLEEQLSAERDKIAQLTARIEQSLPEDCAIEDYDEVLAESEESYRTALENLKMHRTTLEFNLKALHIAESDYCCYLCQRKFDSPQQQSKLLEELRSRTGAGFEQTLQQTAEEEKQYLDSLRALAKDVGGLKDAKAGIQGVQSRVQMTKEAVRTSKDALDAVRIRLDGLKQDVAHAEGTLRPLVEDAVRLKKEARSVADDTQRTSDELSIYGGPEEDVRTVDELQARQREINVQLKSLRQEVGSLQEEKESRSREFNNLVSLVREKTFKANEIERSLQERGAIEREIKDRADSVRNLEAMVTKLQADIAEASQEAAAAHASLERTKRDHLAGEQAAKSKLDVLARQAEQYESLNRQIKQFEQADLPALERCNAEVERSEQDIARLGGEIEQQARAISEEVQRLRDSKNEQKNLALNVDLLDLRAQLEQTRDEIRRLDLQNAEAERDRYQQESLRLRGMFEKLSSENAGRLGEIKQLQNQIQSLTRQLQTEYKDVDKTYEKEWVKLQTKTLVTDDIDTYSKALDSAIMRYHSLKMQDINRIVDELWKRTYSGTDVDTIRIKSDEVGSTTRGKSYNYRVVMYKQDAELDMRGRCSAGQKVLASIIIRLALSETFGANCGVIALDEPTTNLDEENIESLARSLSNIIEVRRHQKNFQLIVITHDEKFLNHMGASSFTDHFYKVRRDDRQKSQIEWVDINRVAE